MPDPDGARRRHATKRTMTLVLQEYEVRVVHQGPRTELRDGELRIDTSELCQALRNRDPRIDEVAVHFASPGESKRIVCTKDVIQPRRKLEGSDPGTGATCVMRNVAVVTCGPIVAFQEGVIEMAGPGADFTPFSQLQLVVIELSVLDSVTPHQHEAACRSAGLFAAEYLAAACEGLTPDQTVEIVWEAMPSDSNLPRIVYIDMLLSQGLLHDNYVLGRNAMEGLPRVIDPRVVLDGGVISGNCVSACDKNTTYHHQNNPIILQLLAGHGSRWDFCGVVLTNEPTRLKGKQDSATATVGLARRLKADGALISKEGFGNPDADLMMIIQGLEEVGIKTVAITDEYAGRDGDSQSLADTAPQADALVSTGNANQTQVLPAVDTVIGPLPDVARLAGGYAQCIRDDGTMQVELQAIVGSTNQLGFGHLSCREM